MNASSNDSTNISMCNVFGLSKESEVAKKLFNVKIGNKSYEEVILLLSYVTQSDNIDSLYIANNAGIIGFKYDNKKYTLL